MDYTIKHVPNIYQTFLCFKKVGRGVGPYATLCVEHGHTSSNNLGFFVVQDIWHINKL